MAMIPSLTAATYPPDVDAAERARLVEVIKDWSIANGLAVRPPPAVVPAETDPEGILALNAPVTLFPSPFPEVCFQQAKSVQRAYNDLYARISQDEDFLARVVEEVAGGDDFIASLWKVHLRVKKEGYVQNLCLGLFRSDYMVHQDPSGQNPVPQVKQVEFNTIASSFGGLSSRASELHKFLAEHEYPYLKEAGGQGECKLPENESVRGLAGGMRAAFDAYSGPEIGLERCIVFLVQGGERNVFDQRHLEYEIHRVSPRIPVFRLPFAEILQRTTIADTPRRQLLYHHPTDHSKVFEVSLVYFRSGYGPSDYPDATAWEARYHIERSAAIKCPTVLTQLAGAKKVQQVLATPKPASSRSELGRFVPEGSPAWKELWTTFTNIYPMDDSEAGLQARRLASDEQECKKYVLKPQREGGGNNFYKSAIPPYLESLPESRWKSYILMELITPPPVANIILRNGKLEQGGVICELGIYGACVWDQSSKAVIYNEEAGYLLRTKGDQSEEGGVAAGYGCMDSCRLV